MLKQSDSYNINSPGSFPGLNICERFFVILDRAAIQFTAIQKAQFVHYIFISGLRQNEQGDREN